VIIFCTASDSSGGFVPTGARRSRSRSIIWRKFRQSFYCCNAERKLLVRPGDGRDGDERALAQTVEEFRRRRQARLFDWRFDGRRLAFRRRSPEWPRLFPFAAAVDLVGRPFLTRLPDRSAQHQRGFFTARRSGCAGQRIASNRQSPRIKRRQCAV